MKREDLLWAFGELDEALIASAAAPPRKRTRSLARFGTVAGGVLAAALALAFLFPWIAGLRPTQDAEPDESFGGDMVITYVYITDKDGSVRIEDAAFVDSLRLAIEEVRSTAPKETLDGLPDTEGEDVLADGEYRIFLSTGDRGGGEYRLTADRLYALGERTVYRPTKEALAALRSLLTEGPEKSDRKE